MFLLVSAIEEFASVAVIEVIAMESLLALRDARPLANPPRMKFGFLWTTNSEVPPRNNQEVPHLERFDTKGLFHPIPRTDIQATTEIPFKGGRPSGGAETTNSNLEGGHHYYTAGVRSFSRTWEAYAQGGTHILV